MQRKFLLFLQLLLCAIGSGWKIGGATLFRTPSALRLAPPSSSLADPALVALPAQPTTIAARSYRSTAKWNAAAQVLLTGLSFTALATAAAHRKAASPQLGLWSDALGANAVSTLLGGVSILWSWSTLLSSSPSTTTIRSFCSMSIGLALAGLFATMLGALQSAGEWVSRAHRLHGLRPFAAAPARLTVAVTAAEILLNQACASALASHLLSLTSHLILLWQLKDTASEAAAPAASHFHPPTEQKL